QFRGDATGLNGDTITDLESGESIIVQSGGGSGGVELTTANVRFNGTFLEIDTDATDFTSPEITINTVTAVGGTLSIASVVSDTLDGTTITFGTVPPPPPPPDGGGGGGGNETGGTGGVVVDDTTP